MIDTELVRVASLVSAACLSGSQFSNLLLMQVLFAENCFCFWKVYCFSSFVVTVNQILLKSGVRPVFLCEPSFCILSHLE